LAKCSAIAQSGERCKGMAIDASGLCHAHHPDRAEARRQAGRRGGKRGGRGRPLAELQAVKDKLEDLTGDVLEGNVDRSDAAVVGQLWNTYVRVVSVEAKIRETEELEKRLEELEGVLTREKERSNKWG
jgi:hypothetical protein